MENNRRDEYIDPPESPSSLLTLGLMDRIQRSWESQIRAGQVEQQQNQGQRIEQQQSRHSHIFHQMREDQDQQPQEDQSTRSLTHLEASRRRDIIHSPIQPPRRLLGLHPQEDQMEQRHQRLRHRLRRRQQRQQQQQQQQHLERSGTGTQVQTPRPESHPSQAHTHQYPRARVPVPVPVPIPRTIHPAFADGISYISRKLHPFINCDSGLPHPGFPKTLLSFNLLTSAQLDSLAIHFDQVYPPRPHSFRYPCPVKPWIVTNGLVRDLGVGTEVKRRRFGRFIGLRGCESPVRETMEGLRDGDGDGNEGGNMNRRMIDQIEKDWTRRKRNWQAAEHERFRARFNLKFEPFDRNIP